MELAGTFTQEAQKPLGTDFRDRAEANAFHTGERTERDSDTEGAMKNLKTFG